MGSFEVYFRNDSSPTDNPTKPDDHIKKQIRRSIEAMDKTTTPPIDCSKDLMDQKSSNTEKGQS